MQGMRTSTLVLCALLFGQQERRGGLTHGDLNITSSDQQIISTGIWAPASRGEYDLTARAKGSHTHTHTHTVSGSLYDSLSWQSTTGPISANYSQRHLELLSNKTGTVHSAMCRSLDVYSRRHHRANLRPGGSEEVTLWWEWWRLWRQPEGGGRSQVKVKESWLTLVLSTKSW